MLVRNVHCITHMASIAGEQCPLTTLTPPAPGELPFYQLTGNT